MMGFFLDKGVHRCVVWAIGALFLSAVRSFGADDQPAGEVVYPMEDFEQFVPGVWQGRAEARGWVGAEYETVHEAMRSARLIWNLTDARGLDNAFVNFVIGRVLAGNPIAVSLWVFAGQGAVGVPLRIWIEDSSGEVYMKSLPLKTAGWQLVEFNLHDISAPWKSGDGNSMMDLPLKLVGFGIDETGGEGEILIDDLAVKTKGRPRDVVFIQTKAQEGSSIGWGAAPAFRFCVKNPSGNPVRKLKVAIDVLDVLSKTSVWRKEIDLDEIAPLSDFEIPLQPEISCGAFDLKWSVRDQQGALPLGEGTLRIARMFGDFQKRKAGPGERMYAKKYDLLGGVFWLCPPQLVAKTGGTWERFETYWFDIERKPGQSDFSKTLERADALAKQDLDAIYFSAVYDGPPFYKIDQLDFGPAWGRMFLGVAKVLGDRVNCYEFGNEDNGPTKFLYTEAARHGAAAVRSQKPYGQLFSSGTAQVDLSWLKWQAKRGLFERLDGLVTHPYSWTSSPEDYGILGQLEQVNTLIDDLGGMKFQLTTEFGYEEKFDQEKRKNWIPRHLVIAAAAGLIRHGLYSWDNHFGIFAGGGPYPAAVSVNAIANMISAHRFAGWLRRDDVWAAVFEKAGQPLLVAWSPRGEGKIDLGGAKDLKILDAYGNAKPEPSPLGALELDESPIYVLGDLRTELKKAHQEAGAAALGRYQALLKESSLLKSPDWNSLTGGSPSKEISQAILRWNPEATVETSDQAVVAQRLRLLELSLRQEADEEQFPPVIKAAGSARLRWQETLNNSVKGDEDLPALRWLLREWERIQDEAALCQELGHDRYAAILLQMDTVFDHLCAVFSKKGKRVLFSVWPYLYAGVSEGGKVREHIQFIPGKPVPVCVRVSSYGSRSYDGSVRLELPEGWRSEPAVWTGKIEAEKTHELSFLVTAADNLRGGIQTILEIKGKPTVKIPFDDYEILASLDVSTPILSSLLPAAPLPILMRNNGTASVSGRIRILDDVNHPALAKIDFDSLKPGASECLDLQLPDPTPVPPYNDWHFFADVATTRGKRLLVPLTIDFDVCVKSAAAPAIDGDLDDWRDAAPLHLDRMEYTQGSFGRTWSKEDLSGTVYTQWDDKCFYIAVDVRDQLFNQNLSEQEIWSQDSVQFALAPQSGPMFEFGLALTPRGPQIWDFSSSKLVESGKLSVKLEQGRTIYEAAVPWSSLPAVKPGIGSKLRFDVVINDDDAIVNRRFMERYGIGIAHKKDAGLLGSLHLIDRPSAQAHDHGDGFNRTVFYENFEEYTPNSVPDAWSEAKNGMPLPVCNIQKGLGKKGGSALELKNGLGSAPNVFSILTRPISGLVAGQTYTLSAWVKGAGIQNPELLLGICSDVYGNEGIRDVPVWKPSSDWQRVELTFTAPAGTTNIFIRNARSVIDSLLIDDMEITKID